MDVHFDYVFMIKMLLHFKLNTSNFYLRCLELITTHSAQIQQQLKYKVDAFFVLGQNITDITKIFTVSKFLLFCYCVF